MRTLLFFLFFAFFYAETSAQKISLTKENWSLGNNKAVFFLQEGKEVIRLERGTIWSNESNFSDGIIEVDLSLNPERSLAGICFRGDDQGNYESIYLRVPQSGREDAIQYVPVFHEEANWQLYSEHQAKYSFPVSGWLHMKIVVKANTAQLFIDTASQPLLTINNLHTLNRSGKIGFTSLSPETYANLVVTPTPSAAPVPVVKRMEEGLITEYLLSEPSVIEKNTKEISYPSGVNMVWKNVETDEDGLLNISRFYAKKHAETYQSRSNDIVWIKKELDADASITKKMNFDFSNRVWVFLNGQIIYHGDHSFFLKGSLYQGSIEKKFISDALYLPLKKGKNELMIGLSAVANGWGIISKIQ